MVRAFEINQSTRYDTAQTRSADKFGATTEYKLEIL